MQSAVMVIAKFELTSEKYNPMDKAAKIEAYYEEEHPYQKAIGKLRELVLQTP